MAMEAKLLLERTFREVGLPLWVERVGGLPDFYVAPDFGFARIHEALPNRLFHSNNADDLAPVSTPAVLMSVRSHAERRVA
jgi:hypothetical protein